MGELKSLILVSKRILSFYFFCFIIVFIVTLLSFVLSRAAFINVSVELYERILENIIRLDGVLFGFTAVMTSLIYRRKEFRTKRFPTLLGWSTISFFCYLLSIFMSLSFLMTHTQDYQIFVPVILTCFGGLCSSIYIILTIIDLTTPKEKKE